MKAKIIIDGKECEIIFTEEQKVEIEKTIKTVKNWEDLAVIEGYVLGSDSEIYLATPSTFQGRHGMDWRRVFATKKQARGVLAMAQLSQLMKAVNGDWKADWSDSATAKFTIECYSGKIISDKAYYGNNFLTFPGAKIRDEFMANHKELIEEYLLIYQ